MSNISSLCPQGIDFNFVASYDEEEMVSWNRIEEMPAEPINFHYEDDLLAEIDADRHCVPGPLDYELFEEDFDDEWDWDDGYYGRPLSEEELNQLAAEEAVEQLQLELEATDAFLPTFSSNHQQFDRHDFWMEGNNKSWKRRNGRKLSKRRMLGNRKGRKDKRQHRQSIRHMTINITPRYSASDYLDGFQIVN